MRPLLIHGFQGLGDNIYQRPAVRHALAHAALHGRGVYLETSWPQVYHDLAGLKFCPPAEKNLRTQRKNVLSLPPETFCEHPPDAQVVTLRYDGAVLDEHNIAEGFLAQMQVATGVEAGFDFGLPVPPEWDKELDGLGLPERFAAFRPATLRREWFNEPRNPAPDVLQRVVCNLHELGLPVVGVADLDERFEWEVPPRTLGVSRKFYRGELSPTAVLALIKRATVTVGPVGFIVPAGVAMAAPTYVVMGGGGAHNAPEVLTDRRMDLSRIGFLSPSPMCMCGRPFPPGHQCDKRIDPQRVDDEFNRWIKPFLK